MPTPVPTYPPGYRLGSEGAPVCIEAFLDFECPFSKKAWPTLLALIDSKSSDRLSITVQPTVLCDHRQTWTLVKALTAIAATEPPKAWKFMDHLFQHQDLFRQSTFENKTYQDLLILTKTLMQQFDASLPTQELMTKIADEGSAIAKRAKTSVRYAVVRGVWSTPTFIINGSEVPQLESSSTLQDWQDFLAAL